ncbi:hypothetical protein Hanom_Chr05g00412941 [Helianthus anomalus]
MGTLSAQGSYPRHSGSSSQVQGFSSQVHGSMEYPPRPSAPMYTGSNIFQDQGSLRSQQSRSSDIHVGDFIPMQTIASSGPTIIPESDKFGIDLCEFKSLMVKTCSCPKFSAQIQALRTVSLTLYGRNRF